MLLAQSKQRGFLTFDDVNAALPPDLLSSVEIEHILSRITALGVEIVEHP
jgi:RNA polymerase primary sigma factor